MCAFCIRRIGLVPKMRTKQHTALQNRKGNSKDNPQGAVGRTRSSDAAALLPRHSSPVSGGSGFSVRDGDEGFLSDLNADEEPVESSRITSLHALYTELPLWSKGETLSPGRQPSITGTGAQDTMKQLYRTAWIHLKTTSFFQSLGDPK